MCQCASVWLCSAKPESRSETRGPGTCFPQGHPRHSRCFQVFRLQRERNFSEACVRAPPLLALSPCPLQSPARLCHRLGPGLHSLAFSLHPRTLGGTGRATAACPQELVRLGPALPAGPEGPRSRQCGDPSRWAPFTSSAGGVQGRDMCSLCTPRPAEPRTCLPKCSCSSDLSRREERGPSCRLSTPCV